MSISRVGSFGAYYGSEYGSSAALTFEQMQVNALYIAKYLKAKGWTLNAIAGMLGNMQAESSINPGRWQSDNVGNTSNGYGLVQWTPATKYISWCEEKGYEDPSTIDNNLSRIIYELENNIQWIATEDYNLSFKEFSTSTAEVPYLASAFLKCYERAGVEVEETRRENAITWYAILEQADLGGGGGSGDSGESGDSTSKKSKKRFNFIIFNRQRRFYS